MKTAVSIPDPIFEAADALARRLGISRSELYARALTMAIEAEQTDAVTARLDAIYEDHDSSLDPGLKHAQRRRLAASTW